jgi:hypothetical protein
MSVKYVKVDIMFIALVIFLLRKGRDREREKLYLREDHQRLSFSLRRRWWKHRRDNGGFSHRLFLDALAQRLWVHYPLHCH